MVPARSASIGVSPRRTSSASSLAFVPCGTTPASVPRMIRTPSRCAPERAALAAARAPAPLLARGVGRAGDCSAPERVGAGLGAWGGWDVSGVANGPMSPGCAPGPYPPARLYEQLWSLAGIAV